MLPQKQGWPAKDMNATLLSKLGWKLHFGEDTLWARVLKAKYLKTATFIDVVPKKDASYTWKSIMGTRKIVEQGTAWIVKKGNKVRFWLDNWLNDGPLILKIDWNIPEQEVGKLVHEYWSGGDWN